jgi:hypothetical protein
LADNQFHGYERLGKQAFGLAEWGNGIIQMSDALNQYNMFPRLKLVEYYDDLASAILPGAWNTYSNFANSPYMTQRCPW